MPASTHDCGSYNPDNVESCTFPGGFTHYLRFWPETSYEGVNVEVVYW